MSLLYDILNDLTIILNDILLFWDYTHSILEQKNKFTNIKESKQWEQLITATSN